jgi:hypothetical protein
MDELLTISVHIQIVFKSVRGTSFTSDIALDDITITNGGCSSSSAAQDTPEQTDLMSEGTCHDHSDILRYSSLLISCL